MSASASSSSSSTSKRPRDDDDDEIEAPPKVARVAIPLEAANAFAAFASVKDPYSWRFVKGDFLSNWRALNELFEAAPEHKDCFVRGLVDWRSEWINNLGSAVDEEFDAQRFADECNFSLMHPETPERNTGHIDHMALREHAEHFPGGERGLCLLFSAVCNFGRVVERRDEPGIRPPSKSERMIHPRDVKPEEKLDVIELAKSLRHFQDYSPRKTDYRLRDMRIIQAAIVTIITRHAFGIQRAVDYTYALLKELTQPRIIHWQLSMQAANVAMLALGKWTQPLSDSTATCLRRAFFTSSLIAEGSEVNVMQLSKCKDYRVDAKDDDDDDDEEEDDDDDDEEDEDEDEEEEDDDDHECHTDPELTSIDLTGDEKDKKE